MYLYEAEFKQKNDAASDQEEVTIFHHPISRRVASPLFVNWVYVYFRGRETDHEDTIFLLSFIWSPCC